MKIMEQIKIDDIIKSENDRLFIVDPECFIIFTGYSADDEKPFIRIGNWTNMPAEIVPLIENIIITDSIIGNPSHEQFNIDISNMSLNSYIGSRDIVSRYLNFQKIFNLDLKNASFVDIEKDIPELSQEKFISEKNQFTGVFYRDGNFKVVHNNINIIDLNETNKISINYSTICNQLNKDNKDTNRYTGSGIIILDNNPIFYHNSYFVSYLFPANFFNDFSLLDIDPGKINELLFPSSNFMNIPKLLKWKNSSENKIKIFSDYENIISIIKNLFSSSNIINENFNGMDYTTESGKTIKNYKDTINIAITYRNVKPLSEKLSIAYIKESKKIKNIINDKPDAIYVSYSVFEETNLILKSIDTPVIIINDGNININKLSQTDNIILYPGIQYDFQKHSDLNIIFEIAGTDLDSYKSLTSKNIKEIINSFSTSDQDDTSYNYNKNIFNLLNIIKLELNSTYDRLRASKLNDISQELKKLINKNKLFKDSSRLKVNHILFNNSIIELVEDFNSSSNKILYDEIVTTIDPNASEIYNKLQYYYNTIIQDRKRLERLLNIFTNSQKYLYKYKDKASILKNEIENRKELYFSNQIHTENFIDIEFNDTVYSSLKENLPNPLNSEEYRSTDIKHSNYSIKEILSNNRKNIIILLFTISVVLLLTLSIIKVNNKTTDTSNSKKISTPTESIDDSIAKQDDKLIQKLNEIPVIISENDIFIYANKVAVKNGYNKIKLSKFKNKNPHWIYPSNVFVMLDNEKITVKKGDTLWNLARDKLVKLDRKFYTIINSIDKTKKIDHNNLIKKADKFAFSKRHLSILNELGTKKNGKK